MEVTPISNRITVTPVTPLKRVGQVRKGRARVTEDQADKPTPEPTPDLAPGTGQLLDLYV